MSYDLKIGNIIKYQLECYATLYRKETMSHANINLHGFDKASPKRKPIDSRMKNKNQIQNFKTQIDLRDGWVRLSTLGEGASLYKKEASKAKFIA